MTCTNVSRTASQTVLGWYLSPKLMAEAQREMDAFSKLEEHEIDFFGDVCTAARMIKNISIIPERLDADRDDDPLADSLEKDDTFGAYHTKGGYIGIDIDMVRDVAMWEYIGELGDYDIDDLLLTIASELARAELPCEFYPYGILSQEYVNMDLTQEQRVQVREWRQLSQSYFEQLIDNLDPEWYDPETWGQEFMEDPRERSQDGDYYED